MKQMGFIAGILLISAGLSVPANATGTSMEQSNKISSQRKTALSTVKGNNESKKVAKPASSMLNKRPGNSNHPNGGSSGVRPGGNNNHPNGGSSGVRPGGNNNRPNGGSSGIRPGGNNNRPNGGSSGIRPGGNNNRPNGGNNHFRPGGNSAPAPGGNNHYRPGGNSAPAPGAVTRPPHTSYRPPMRPRWERPLPPPPPRYNYVRVGAPSISTILGLTFGSLIDYGINSLINAGYTVSSAMNNAIYLNNVSQFGIVWPEATIYYGNGGMSGARFQYAAYSPTDYRYRSVYSQLCAVYGNPVSTTYNNGHPTSTWWGGNNTGYITLTYGPALNQNGATMYYTDLIYGL